MFSAVSYLMAGIHGLRAKPEEIDNYPDLSDHNNIMAKHLTKDVSEPPTLRVAFRCGMRVFVKRAYCHLQHFVRSLFARCGQPNFAQCEPN